MKPQIIETAAGETLVVLTLADYEALRDLADATAHARAVAAIENGADEVFTVAEALDFADAPTPFAFWRAKRGLTQSALAQAAGISEEEVADLESGRRQGDARLFKTLAAVLRVRMEWLVAD
jgi:DNA-binding XRE family transcriptional regulator